MWPERCGPGQSADTKARWEQVKGSLGLMRGGEEEESVPRPGQDPYLGPPPFWPGCRGTAEVQFSEALGTAQPDHSAPRPSLSRCPG